MKHIIPLSHFAVVITSILFSIKCSASDTHEHFLRCLYRHNSTSISNVVYSKTSPFYSSILQFTIQNQRLASNTTLKPLVIVTPLQISHVQATIICSQRHGLQIQTRSGGLDFEGLSYVSHVPFVIIDLINLQEIQVDVKSKTAWVQAGASIGELYYRISEKSRTLGFPAGVCPTVGVGGHFSGGGYGFLMRKYGTAADNVIDAHMVDVKGRFLDREAMGEDLFWAIRGGGGASFGVILAWKVKLVEVPKTVTVFKVPRTLEQNATKLIHKWQFLASNVHNNLTINLLLQRGNSSKKGKVTVQATFEAVFLGGVDKLIPLMQQSFPELGLVREDCTEMSWIESVLSTFAAVNGKPLEILLNRTKISSYSFKAKSDFVRHPIPESGLEGIWPMFYEDEAKNILLQFFPYGGRMDELVHYRWS